MSLVSIVPSFDVGIVALWGSFVIVCHCTVMLLSLSWLCQVCAGAGPSSPLVHGGGGPRHHSSVVVVGPHRRLCGRWALIIVHVTALSVHCHRLLFGCHITESNVAPGHWG